MGAAWFETYGPGRTVDEAHACAARAARYDHGHNGYTGTIAEKDVHMLAPMVPDVPALDVREMFALACCDDEDAITRLYEWYGLEQAQLLRAAANNKWGPAVAVECRPDEVPDYVRVGPGELVWLFFGYASC